MRIIESIFSFEISLDPEESPEPPWNEYFDDGVKNLLNISTSKQYNCKFINLRVLLAIYIYKGPFIHLYRKRQSPPIQIGWLLEGNLFIRRYREVCVGVGWSV